MRPQAVVFDIGRVLFDWNLRYLFEKLIDDPAELDWFLAHVVTEQWHFQSDAGRPLAEMLPELKALHPDRAALIAKRQLDGGSTAQVLRRLTFPMLSPVLILVFVLRTIDAVRMYDAVASLTRGGPGAVTEVLTFYLYRLGLKFFRVDQASAVSLVFLFVTVVFVGIVMRRMMRQQGERALQE